MGALVGVVLCPTGARAGGPYKFSRSALCPFRGRLRSREGGPEVQTGRGGPSALGPAGTERRAGQHLGTRRARGSKEPAHPPAFQPHLLCHYLRAKQLAHLNPSPRCSLAKSSSE